jgi:predicted RNA-binding Zn-ribbon protein involved in translation (DUF1610 family)
VPNLFDKIRGQIDAGITKVTTKSRVTVETTRLAGQIRRITKEKEEALLRLGSRVYKEMSNSGQLSLEEVQREIKRVQAMDQEITNLQQEIDRLEALDAATPWVAKEEEKPIATCTCGAPLTEGTKFCGNCGINAQEIIAKAKAEQLAKAEAAEREARAKAEQLAQAEAAKRAAAVGCPNCGTEVSATARFCRSCGTALGERQEATVEPQVTPYCPHCGSEITSTAWFCRHCGQPTAKETPSAKMQESEAGGGDIADGVEEQRVEPLLNLPEKRGS